MVEKILCDGIVLAAALREILDGRRDVDGLMFGTIQHRTVNVISDMHADYSREESTAVLHHLHVTSAPWHDATGRIDADQISRIVAARAPMRLIGWFSSRLNTPCRSSLRERAVHASLAQWAGVSSEQPCVPLIFGLLNGTQNAAHLLTQDFRTFVPTESGELCAPAAALPVVFRNLGQSSQFEFGAFEQSSYADIPDWQVPQQHPLEGCVAEAIEQLEQDAVSVSEALQQVSVEQAELAELQAELQQQQRMLMDSSPI